MTNEFPTGTGKKTYAQCIFIKPEYDDYIVSENFKNLLEDRNFKEIICGLVEFGLQS